MSAIRELVAKPLTREAFAPFGDVIAAEGDSFPINDGRTERFHALARVDLLGEDAQAILSVFRGQPLEPLVIDLMERHPLGSQAFVPLDNREYWVVVAPPGEFDAELVQVFLAGGHQGVNYRAGTWHAPVLPCLRDSEFLVVDRQGQGNNCETAALPVPIRPVRGRE